MKRAIFGPLLFLMFLNLSCTKDLDDESSFLGSWIETAPVEGRSSLYFTQDNMLHLKKGDAVTEEFTYSIEGDTLYLRLSDTPEAKSEFYIELLEQDQLKVENLYISIPEQEPAYIIFKRN